MTTKEFKEMTRAVVLALRDELTVENKEMLEKLSMVNERLRYNTDPLKIDLSHELYNYLSQKTDGLFATTAYVTTESSPIGEIIAFMGKSVPDHYLACDGTVYNIGEYTMLEAFFIKEFGSVNFFGGNGTTTFAVPDLRGEFLRGTGVAGRNSGSGADVGVHQAPTIHNYIGKESTDYVDIYSTDSNYPTHGKETMDTYTMAGPRRWFMKSGGVNNETGIDEFTSRPTNTSVMYCIKYEPTWADGTGGSGGGSSTPTEEPLTEEEIQGIITYVLTPIASSEAEAESSDNTIGDASNASEEG